MRKQIKLLLWLWLSGTSLFAQNLRVFHEASGPVVTLYASNSELFPVSVSLELDLTNYIFSGGDKKVFVIPPTTSKMPLGELTVKKQGAPGRFGYKFKSAIGDVTIKDYDRQYVYDLPFQKGESYKVMQGYNGSFSHKGENSLDFQMPEGTKITAARDGTVVRVVQNNTGSCPQEECKKYNNYITILHSDGSFADYLHIKLNGALVKPGDKVMKGDVIANSGNVGWSSTPHLHFVCYLGGFDKRPTLETSFKTGNGDKAGLLEEGIVYSRNY